MSKIFTESQKWKDSWFRGLSYTEKLFWLYLLDNCDYAGIYEEDLAKASFDIGLKITDKVYERFSERVFFFEHTKQRYCVIKKFIEFQYKWLKEDYNPHKAAFKCIEKYSHHLCLKDLKYLELSSLDQGLTKACPRLLGMDKDMGNSPKLIKSDKQVLDIPGHLKTVWPEFINMRKANRKPATIHAQRLLIKQLAGMGSQIEQANIVEQSIKNSWQGLFEIKNNYSQNTSNMPNSYKGINLTNVKSEEKK